MSTTKEPETSTPAKPEGGHSGEEIKQRGPVRRWWRRRRKLTRWLIVSVITVVLLVVVAGAGLFYALTRVPLPDSVDAAEASTVYYRDGTTQLVKIGTINRINVPLSAVSIDAQHAVLAAEDKNFYSESGISFRGILRALWADIRGKEIQQGGSTITQQYARNAYLNQSRTFSRKLREIAIAIKLDRKYSKDQILEFYLNTIYFGRGAYGIEAAARAYFGVSAKQLTAEQAAVIAGLIRAPSELDPRINPDAAQQRFHEVLGTMVEKRWLDSGRADSAQLPPTLPLQPSGANAPQTPQDAYVRNAVVAELQAHGISEDQINRGGLSITTTLDPQAQRAAIDAVNQELGSAPPDIQPAVVAVQPGTGEIRAYYGGRYFGTGPNGYSDYVDNATYPIQAGSAFKPITLATALSQGFSLNSYYNGNSNQVVVPGYPQGVRNFGGESLGTINLLRATALSVNSVFVKLGQDVGVNNAIKMAHALGIPDSTKLSDVSSFPLGVDDVRPLDLADVYATFAAQGVQAAPHLVAKVTDRDGNVLYEGSTSSHRVLSPTVAADLTYALQQPFQYGTAAGDAPYGRPVAGKTGTTDSNKSAWLCGYTPQLAGCVALFRDKNQTLNGLLGYNEVTGGTVPGQTFRLFMTEALQGQPVMGFPAPVLAGVQHGAPPPPSVPPSSAPRRTYTLGPQPQTTPSSTTITPTSPATGTGGGPTVTITPPATHRRPGG